MGRWALQQACLAAVKLQIGRSRPLLMHVNLCPQQLRDPTIVASVRQALDDAGLAPELLVLEVTEGFLLDDEFAIERLHQLHQLGVLIAIDDFGTGYTSINYIQQLPVQILKIDRSFVSGDALEVGQRKAFLHAIIGLAKSLNLRSVAEGVEDLDQLHQLEELGCDMGQGFLWAHAMPLSTTQAMIDEIESSTHDPLNPKSLPPAMATLH
jgi:EAL domain-containing protein (putative c-di-GMP-specific phosphodiesterase class I)